jgi:predicted RNA-binding Zn-ribbon protein involved in translation (DUF1610 family)
MSDDPKHTEDDRQSWVSVAATFARKEQLVRLGSGHVELTCPACGAKGIRYANPDEDFRFEGFEPLTAGGLASIVCQCNACGERVTLPHKKA